MATRARDIRPDPSLPEGFSLDADPALPEGFALDPSPQAPKINTGAADGPPPGFTVDPPAGVDPTAYANATPFGRQVYDVANTGPGFDHAWLANQIDQAGDPSLPSGFQLDAPAVPAAPAAAPPPAYQPTFSDVLFGRDDQNGGNVTGILPSLAETFKAPDFGRLWENTKTQVGADLTSQVTGGQAMLEEGAARANEPGARDTHGGGWQGHQYRNQDPAARAKAFRDAAAENLAIAREADAGADAAQSPDAGLIERTLQGGATSALESAAGLVTGGPIGAAAVMGAGQGASRYAQLRNKGETPESAAKSAALTAGLEGFSEYLPGEAFFEKMPGFKAKLVKFLASEVPGEEATSLGELVDDYEHGIRDDITGADVAAVMSDTALQTIVGGAIQAGAAHGAQNPQLVAEGLKALAAEVRGQPRAGSTADVSTRGRIEPTIGEPDNSVAPVTPEDLGTATEEPQASRRPAEQPQGDWQADPHAPEGEPFAHLGNPEAPEATLTERDGRIVAVNARTGEEIGTFDTPNEAAIATEEALKPQAEPAELGTATEEPGPENPVSTPPSEKTAAYNAPGDAIGTPASLLPGAPGSLLGGESAQPAPHRAVLGELSPNLAAQNPAELAKFGLGPVGGSGKLLQERGRDERSTVGNAEDHSRSEPSVAVEAGRNGLPGSRPRGAVGDAGVGVGNEVIPGGGGLAAVGANAHGATVDVPRGAEQRKGVERRSRKRVAEMGPDELRRELLTHELTGIPNRRAYEEAPKLAHQTAIDVDSLKWVNDNMGHDSGNHLLQAVAEALKDETGDAYHLSGDEFALQSKTPEEAAAIMQRVQQRLDGAVMSVTMPDGKVVTLSGMGVSYGTGKDLTEADAALQAHKSAREATGERAGRGQQPPGATRTSAETGREDHEGAAPEEEPGAGAGALGTETAEGHQRPDQVTEHTERHIGPQDIREHRAKQRAAGQEGDADSEIASQISGELTADEDGLRKAVEDMLGGARNAPDVMFVDGTEGIPRHARSRLRTQPGMVTVGAYDSRTDTVYLNTQKVTTPAHAAFVAAHEIAGHQGLLGYVGRGSPQARQALDKALALAAQNPTVAKLAQAIQAKRTQLTNLQSTEEALAELAAAQRTGNYAKLDERYGVKVPASLQEKIRSAIARFLETLKNIIAKRKGVQFTDKQVRELLEGAWRYVQTGETSTKGLGDETLETKEQEHTPAFKKWFGDSKVVDENGEPLVVYHGTTRGQVIKSFRPGKNKWNGRDLGMHFGAIDAANERLRDAKKERRTGAPSVFPVYLSIKNPLEMPDAGSFTSAYMVGNLLPTAELRKAAMQALKPWQGAGDETGAMDALRDVLKAAGYDGVVYRNEYEFEGSAGTRGDIRKVEKKIAAQQRTVDELARNQNRKAEQLDAARAELESLEEQLRTLNDRLDSSPRSKSWIAFEPSQIKSAIGNQGTFDATHGDIAKSENDDGPEDVEKTLENTADRTKARDKLDQQIRDTVAQVETLKKFYEDLGEPEFTAEQEDALERVADEYHELQERREDMFGSKLELDEPVSLSEEPDDKKPQASSKPSKPQAAKGGAGKNYVDMYRSKGPPVAPARAAVRGEELEVPKEPIRREHVMKLFQREFKLKIYEGKPFKVRGALGFFRPSNYEVRNKFRNDLEVAAHEVFHWIDRTYPTIRKLYHLPRFRDELYGVSYDDTKLYEGFAEFGRLFMTQEPEAITRLPTFYEAFVKEAKKVGMLEKLERVQRLMHQWYLQGAENRARSKIGTTKAPVRQRLEAFADGWADRAIASSLDWLQAAKVIERNTTGGIADDAAMSPYKSMRLLAGARSTVNSWLNYGTVTWTPKGDLSINGKGLRQIFEPVADVFDQAMGYFVAERANELRKYGKEKLFSPDEIAALRARAQESGKMDEIKAAHAEYQQYTKRLLKFAEQSGVLNPASRAVWEDMYQNYVPFYRVAEKFGSLDPRMTGNTRGGLFRKLTGGTANVNDVFENMALNTATIVHASLKNVAKAQLFATIEKSPLGQRYAVKIPKGTEVKTVAMEQIERVLKEFAANAQAAAHTAKGNAQPAAAMEYLQMAQLAAALGNRSNDLGQATMQDVQDQASFFFTGKPPSIPDKEQVLVRGKPVWYQIGDPLLWDMLTHLNYHQPISFADRIFGAAKRTLTRGVTVSPEFQVANILRDTFSAATMGKQWPVVDSLRAMRDIWSESDAYKHFIANGGSWGNATSDEAKKVRVMMKAHGVKGVLQTPAALIDMWDKWGQSFELSTRLAEYKRQVAAGKSMREGAFQGREVSTDFAMRGNSSVARFASTSLAFFNARLQGLYRLERELFERGGRQSWNGEKQLQYAMRATTMLTIPALLTYLLLNRGNDDYDELGEELKSLNTVIPVPGGGGVYLIPKPFETGAIFQEIPIRLWEYYEKRDGAKLTRAAEFMFMNTFNFSPVPQVLAPPATIAMNRQWNGLPVVPRNLENVEPREQFLPWTPETYKKIGEQFNVSPVKLQQLVEGYFGTIAIYGIAGSDALVTSGHTQPEKKSSQYPLLRRFMREQPYNNTSYEERFYDLLDETTKVVDTANLYRKQGRGTDLDQYLSRADKGIFFAISKATTKVAERGAQINALIRKIRNDDAMSPAEKAQQIDQLQDEQNELFKEAVKELDTAQLRAYKDALEKAPP